MQVNQGCQPSDFSTNLFWDIDPATLDMDRHRKYIVARVLECGTFEDWRILCRRFTLSGIIETARTLRSMDPKAFSFLSVVGHVPKESFRCCTSKPSTSTHWSC
jgi:hypothetical protein